MALALNSSDALASALTYLFCVDDDNTVKEIKASTALTVHANVLLPTSGTPSTSSPYGRSFRTLANGDFNFYGVTFADLAASTAGPVSVFVVTNQFNASNSNCQLFQSAVDPRPSLVVDAATGKVRPSGRLGAISGTQTSGSVSTGSHSFGFTRNGDNANSVFAYIDGALDSAFTGGLTNAGGEFGFGSSGATFNGIGGNSGQGYLSMDWVYIAVFAGTQLTDADFTRLHASLTGSNAFALVSAGGGTNATATGATLTATSSLTAGSASGTAAGTASGATLTATSSLSAGTATADNTGTLTTPVLKNNTGTVLASETGVTVNVYNSATGALIVRKTGQTSDASGIVTVTDALIVAGTTYAYEVVLTSNGRRLPTAAAT